MTAALPVIVLAVVISIDLWVYAEATAHAERGTRVVLSLGSLRVDSPLAWFAACLILAILLIPLYLAKPAP